MLTMEEIKELRKRVKMWGRLIEADATNALDALEAALKVVEAVYTHGPCTPGCPLEKALEPFRREGE